MSVIAALLVVRILSSINRVIDKAENVVDSVEAAAVVLKDAGGHLSILKLIKNILDLIQRKK